MTQIPNATQNTIQQDLSKPDAARIVERYDLNREKVYVSKMTDLFVETDKLSLHWKARMTPEEAIQFAACCEPNGNMDSEELLLAIYKINETIPPMWFYGENGNNGKPCHNFEIGREYKRVLYVQIAKRSAPKNLDYEQLTRTLKTITQAEEAYKFEEDEYFYNFRISWV